MKDCKETHEVMQRSYLYGQSVEVWEEPPRRQPEELVPRQVELSQGGQDQNKVFEVIVAQVQHLHIKQP